MSAQDKKLAKFIKRWAFWPDLCVKETVFLNAPEGEGPSPQQLEVLQEVGKLAYAKVKSALIQKGKWSPGDALTEGEAFYAKKKGISIRSGHGCGKDGVLSWIYIWLLMCWGGSRGQVTAPTADQLNTILWSEFRKWIRYSAENQEGKASLLSENLVIQSDTVYNINRKGETFVKAKTANLTGSEEEQGEALAGQHSNYMILAVDEASGMPRGVYKPIEGAMTQDMNFAILIGNPTRGNGYFYDTFHSDRDRWITVHWNSENSPLVNQEDLKVDQEKYGRSSNWYRTRRLGEFPKAEPDTLIPLEWVEAAVNKEIIISDEDPVIMAVDPAGMGRNKTAIAIRKGRKVLEIKTLEQVDTMEVVGFCLRVMDEYDPQDVGIDPIGLGAGVYDRLRELGNKVVSVDVRRNASNEEKFFKLRDELWWKAREAFEKGTVSIPKDDGLIGELSAVKYKPHSSGKIKIESKADMKARGIQSPDKADAFIMTLYFRDSAYRQQLQDKYRRKKEPENYKKELSWMSA
jgi:hypothetical protein